MEIIPTESRVRSGRITNELLFLHTVLFVIGGGLLAELNQMGWCGLEIASCHSRSGALLIILAILFAFFGYILHSVEKQTTNIVANFEELPESIDELSKFKKFDERYKLSSKSKEDASRFLNSLKFQQEFYIAKLFRFRLIGHDFIFYEFIALLFGTFVWAFGDLSIVHYITFVLLLIVYARIVCLCWSICEPRYDFISDL